METKIKSRIRINTKKAAKAVGRANFTSLGKAAGTHRKIWMGMIKQSPKSEPGPAGGPIRTRRGQAKKAVAYALNKSEQNYRVGYTFTGLGLAGAINEHGRDDHPARPTGKLSLNKIRDRLPKFWAGSLREGD